MTNNLFLQNKYTNWYYAIINRAIKRGIIEPNEQHHIIPESFYKNRKRTGAIGWLDGDPNDPSNNVLLSPREHLLCHRLLVKMTTGIARSKMYNALHMTTIKSGNQNRNIRLTSRQYEKIKNELRNRLKGKSYEEIYGAKKGKQMRKEKSIANSGIKNPYYGKNHSDAVKKLISNNASKPKSIAWKESASKNRKGRIPINKGKTFEELYGIERANEIKKKQSLPGKKNGFYGKTHSAEQRKRKSTEKLSSPKIKCYYCSKEVDHMNYSRWHGDNCKLKDKQC